MSDRYVRPFRAPTAYFSPPIRRELLWVGIKLLSYCLCDINNKKISNPAYFASCYCNKAWPYYIGYYWPIKLRVGKLDCFGIVSLNVYGYNVIFMCVCPIY